MVSTTKSCCLYTQIMSSHDIPDVMSVLNNMVYRSHAKWHVYDVLLPHS